METLRRYGSGIVQEMSLEGRYHFPVRITLRIRCCGRDSKLHAEVMTLELNGSSFARHFNHYGADGTPLEI